MPDTERDRKRIAQRSQRRLAFEILENRRVFAGVTFSFSGGYATDTGSLNSGPADLLTNTEVTI